MTDKWARYFVDLWDRYNYENEEHVDIGAYRDNIRLTVVGILGGLAMEPIRGCLATIGTEMTEDPYFNVILIGMCKDISLTDHYPLTDDQIKRVDDLFEAHRKELEELANE